MSCRLLNISEAVSLGIHSMRVLSVSDKKMTSLEIAAELKVSNHHLSKVMRKLVVASLVSVEKGPKGGFWLTEAQRQSSLMEVYKALETDTDFNSCLMGESYCGGGNCIFGELLKTIRAEFVKCFNETKVAINTEISFNKQQSITKEIYMKKMVCTVCGCVMDAENTPDVCPQCKAPKEKFVLRDDSAKLVWADEHKIGVAKGLDAEVVEGLRANFTGECTEVGMYLAMSRQADREGYPEVAEAYKRIAFEEAEHAAKFAELLGECVDADTKKNLSVRVEAEHGATAGKLALAKRAKELGYDAIHDTVHEMCKDEARHGSAFLGLLNRYFK